MATRKMFFHVEARATRWVSDEPFPGLVELELIDANGRTWTFIDKAPIFNAAGHLTPDARYPLDIKLACTVIAEPSPGEHSHLLISTAEPWGVESVDGESEFLVHHDQLTLGDAH